jgi:hypothetical protein
MGTLARIDAGYCPDCGHKGFVLGPRGGSARNIECGNGSCRARFLVGEMSFTHHILCGQRIPKQREGGGDWSAIPVYMPPNWPADADAMKAHEMDLAICLLQSTLKECSDSLEAELNQRYMRPDVHPRDAAEI